jgi:hypothetical protein
MNHHSILRKATGSFTLCGSLVPHREAKSGSTVDCPACAAKLRDKAENSIAAARAHRGQVREFYQGVAEHYSKLT